MKNIEISSQEKASGKKITALLQQNKIRKVYENVKKGHFHLDIPKLSQNNFQNIQKQLRDSSSCFGIAKHNKHSFLTDDEVLVVRALLKRPWKLKHLTTFHIWRSMDRKKVLRSVKDRGISRDQLNPVRARLNTDDHVYFTIGIGDSFFTPFTMLGDESSSDYVSIELDLSKILSEQPPRLRGAWCSTTLANYSTSESAELVLGDTNYKISYSRVAKIESYNYADGSSLETSSSSDEDIFELHQIQLGLCYRFILWLRTIGGSYYQHILKNFSNNPILDNAFNLKFGTLEYEVLLPKRFIIFPDDEYVTVKSLDKHTNMSLVKQLKELVRENKTPTIHTQLQQFFESGFCTLDDSQVKRILHSRHRNEILDEAVYCGNLFAFKYFLDRKLPFDLLDRTLTLKKWEMAKLLLENGCEITKFTPLITLYLFYNTNTKPDEYFEKLLIKRNLLDWADKKPLTILLKIFDDIYKFCFSERGIRDEMEALYYIKNQACDVIRTLITQIPRLKPDYLVYRDNVMLQEAVEENNILDVRRYLELKLPVSKTVLYLKTQNLLSNKLSLIDIALLNNNLSIAELLYYNNHKLSSFSPLIMLLISINRKEEVSEFLKTNKITLFSNNFYRDFLLTLRTLFKQHEIITSELAIITHSFNDNASVTKFLQQIPTCKAELYKRDFNFEESPFDVNDFLSFEIEFSDILSEQKLSIDLEITELCAIVKEQAKIKSEQFRDQLISAINNYLSWRDNKTSPANDRGFKISFFTKYRHSGSGGRTRALNLRGDLEDLNKDPVSVIAEFLQKNPPSNHHSLKSYIIDAVTSNDFDDPNHLMRF